MVDPGRRWLSGVLLIAAAPLLVGGGLVLGTTVGDGSSTTVPDAAAPVASVPVPAAAPTSPASATTPRARGLRPDTVVVPSLDVRADVTPIATQDGTLTPPSDPLDVGWWSGGARPGDGTGAAVITGHTVHTGGGAFDDLEELATGDRVLVLSGGATVAYDVATVEVLSRDELARASRSIFARSGLGRLVLVTCEDWDGTAYRSNVVVTARPSGA